MIEGDEAEVAAVEAREDELDEDATEVVFDGLSFNGAAKLPWACIPSKRKLMMRTIAIGDLLLIRRERAVYG